MAAKKEATVNETPAMETPASVTETQVKTGMELVKYKLPRSREKKGPVFVSVNGKTYLIRRGEEVTIPLAVKEILENQEKMDNLAEDRISDLENGSIFA